MRKIRLISPFISLLLIILALSGSFGFTLIHHTCLHCGTDETIATLTGEPVGEDCCSHSESAVCCHGDCEVPHRHSNGEATFSDDCCTHEAERIVTDELVRAESQSEIIPYFLAATVIAVIEDQPPVDIRRYTAERPFHCGRDLTTILCRIQS